MTKKLIYTSRAVFANVCNTLIYSVLCAIGGGKSCDLVLCKRTFYQPFHHIGVLCLLGMAPLFVSCGKDIPSDAQAPGNTRTAEPPEPSDSTGSTLHITINDEWDGETFIEY